MEQIRRFAAQAVRRARVPFVILGVLLLGAVVVVGGQLDRHVGLVETWIASLGPAGVIAYVVLFTILTSFFVPESLLSILGGVFFGFWLGLVAVTIAMVTAASFQFWVAHILLKERALAALARRPALSAIQRAVAGEDFRLLVMMRLAPFNPAVISYVLGASGVRFRWMLAGLLGLVPHVLWEVYLGYAGKRVAHLGGQLRRGFGLDDVVILSGIAAGIWVIVRISKLAQRAIVEAVEESE